MGRRREDAATASVGELADVLEEAAEELRALAERARTLRERRLRGESWSEIVTTERRPLAVERISDLLERLATAGAAFRREEARALSQEGLSQQRIAELFGVTRQRIGALLAPSRTPGRTRGRGATRETLAETRDRGR